MYVLLPGPTSDLATLEKNLTDSPGTLSTLELHLDPSYLTSVSLPRFQLEQTLDLSTPLQRLGAQRMFKPGEADFSGITDQERIHVDYAVQKAFIEVTETGTEAAAATGISFRSGSFVEPHEFKCDRPFLYLIKDEQTNMIWFMGRFLGPEKE